MTDNDSPIAAAVIKLADSVDRLATQVQMNTNALHPPHLCCNQQLELEQPRDDDDAEQLTPQTEDDDDCNIIANDNIIDDDESSDDNSNGDQAEDEADADDNNNDKDKDESQKGKEQQESNKRPDSKGNIGTTPSDMISTRSARDRAPPTRQTKAGASDSNSNSNFPTAWTRPRGSPCQCFPNACTCGLYETGPSYSNSTFPTAWTRPRGSPCQCLPNACTCSRYL